jgi:RluA family pseudouridine synthase
MRRPYPHPFLFVKDSVTTEFKKIPKRYHPKEFDILYEDHDLIVGNKKPGLLSVAALWNRDNTAYSLLNQYVRKGNSKSKKSVYIVHRLDQMTSGVLIFAKSEAAKDFLKENWPTTEKIYYAIVYGNLEKKQGVIESYLEEDEDYYIHSSEKPGVGKLARTEYKVLVELKNMSLIEVNLLTGRKNQIRVHLAGLGHAIVGDIKYGLRKSPHKFLALHAKRVTFSHPFSRARVQIEAPTPHYFKKLIAYKYDSDPKVV